MKTYNTEGLEFIDHDKIEKQRGVLTYMVKKIGTNILSGKSIMNVSLPIHVFDSRSLLEAYAYGYRISRHFFSKVNEASNLERIKLLTVYILATLSMNMTGEKPFNPILGETFQAKIGDNLIYCEQTSHHPPIFNFYVKNPYFISYGYGALEANAGANSASAIYAGKFNVKSNDGILYSFKLPDFKINGLMLGNRYVNYSSPLIVEDLVIPNNLDK
jgi:hypothetical protein